MAETAAEDTGRGIGARGAAEERTDIDDRHIKGTHKTQHNARVASRNACVCKIVHVILSTALAQVDTRVQPFPLPPPPFTFDPESPPIFLIEERHQQTGGRRSDLVLVRSGRHDGGRVCVASSVPRANAIAGGACIRRDSQRER